MAPDDQPFSNFFAKLEDAANPNVPETRKLEVENLLFRTGELFAYVTLLCGQKAHLDEGDVIYNWIRSNYPDDVKRFGKAFINGLRHARRKVFRTDGQGFLSDDPTTMEWLKAMKSRCREHIEGKKRLLLAFRDTTPAAPTWN